MLPPPNEPDEAPPEGFEPTLGPPGYHADFYRPGGIPDTEFNFAVRVRSGPLVYLVGPFDDLFEATNWAAGADLGLIEEFLPLFRPDDFPEGGLADPEEPEDPPLPLFDPPPADRDHLIGLFPKLAPKIDPPDQNPAPEESPDGRQTR